MRDRRSTKFTEKLSTILVLVSAVGAMLVLIDPVISFTTADGTVVKVGGSGFSDQLKGAVISLILVSGFAAVISYWLGSSAGSEKKSDAITKIAEAAPVVTAAAVAVEASKEVPVQPDEVKP